MSADGTAGERPLAAGPLVGSLAGVEVLVFDIVGTLVDEVGTVERETREEFAAVGLGDGLARTVAREWCDRFAAMTGAVAEDAEPWGLDDDLRPALLRDVLDEHGVALPEPALRRLGTVGRRFAPWPDVPRQLDALAARTTVTGLTNAGYAQVAEMSARAGLRWHAVLSTQSARTYKPDPAAYQIAVHLLDLEPSRALFVAAHPWDLRGAASHGFRTAFLPREHAGEPEPGDRFDVELRSLDELAAGLG